MTRLATALIVLVAALVMAPFAYGRSQPRGEPLDPIIFVHGFEGSGGQFESQQLRFAQNGYPARYVQVLEYNTLPATGVAGLNPLGIPLIELDLFPRLDRLIAQVKAQTGRPKVELVAHSLGTKLMQDYLNSSPQRAANVAHYVNIDGQTAKAPPGGVPTLALWATRGPLSPPGRSIGGAENVSIPDSTHVQSATSPLSFRAMYRFFTGRTPRTTQIVAQRGRITLSGRDVNFPVNGGLTGATVQAWPVNAAGRRTSAAPIATYKIGPSGDFGPFTVRSGTRLEFAELRNGFPTHHFYFEPFVRSDHLIRLLESDLLRSAGGVPAANSVAMLVLRYKELWGDQGSQSDVLTVNGLSVCNATTCPLSKEVNALFVADFDHDDRSNTSFTWPLYAALGFFISSVDVFAPAHSPPTGEVTVGLRSRGAGPVRKISFPDWPATTDVVTAQFDDWNFAPAAKAKCVARHRHARRRAGCRGSR
jgi:pimeloyl-ACP methyl ester carboxylesterase